MELTMHHEIQIHKAGNGEALINWYNNGANGQIDWGSEGDFDACVAIAGKYLDNPQGFCQLRHIDATGEPAGKASGEIGKAAPFSGRFAYAPSNRTQTYIEQARSCAERAEGFRRLQKWESAAFAHNDASDAYRKAAMGETDGNAEILNAQADAQDRLAKYCEFLDHTPQNSPAEIGKAHGNVPAYPGTSYENPPFKAGSQDWGWLGEGLSTKTPEYNYAPTGNDLPDESSAEPHSDWQSEDAQ
jgi:hypothetical protein